MRKSRLADDYLDLKAKQAELAGLEEGLKKKLLALKDNEIEGTKGRVTISQTAGRVTLDADLLKTLNPAIYNQVKKIGAPGRSFRVKARVS